LREIRIVADLGTRLARRILHDPLYGVDERPANFEEVVTSVLHIARSVVDDVRVEWGVGAGLIAVARGDDFVNALAGIILDGVQAVSDWDGRRRIGLQLSHTEDSVVVCIVFHGRVMPAVRERTFAPSAKCSVTMELGGIVVARAPDRRGLEVCVTVPRPVE
jgi:hypothetical protein